MKNVGSVIGAKYEESSRNFYIAEERYEIAKSALQGINDLLKKCNIELAEKKHESDILQCAKLYGQIQTSTARIKELKKLIEAKENNSEDAERIAILKYSVFVKAKEMEKIQSYNSAVLQTQIDKENEALREYKEVRKKTEVLLENAGKNYNKAESELEAAKKNTDKRLGSLHINLMRKFDGFYATDEVESEKSEKKKISEQLDSDIKKIEALIQQTEKRKNDIPGEKADIQIKQSYISKNLSKSQSELDEYNFLYKRLLKLCEKYNLTDNSLFSSLLKTSVRKDIDVTMADITASENKRQKLEDKKNAAENGCLHIIPEIMRYIESTGISYITGEEYLSRLLENESISNNRAEKILSDYPEFAYSLLFPTHKELQSILSAGNIDWLPAVVPLFTMEQVEHIFDGSMEKSSFLSAYDSVYFTDKESYVSRIDEGIVNTDNKITYLKEHLTQAKEELKLIESFNYSESWKTQQEDIISSLEHNLTALADRLRELDKESEKLEAEMTKYKEKLETIKSEIYKLNAWFSSFDELKIMLSDEIELYNKQHSSYVALQKAKDDYKKACDEYESCKAKSEYLENQLKGVSEALKKTRDILDRINSAKEADIIDDELEILFSQYNSCLSSMHENLEGLRNDLESGQEDLQKAEEELNTYNCNEAEYKTSAYSLEQLRKVKEEYNKIEKKKELLQSECDKNNREHGSAEEGFKKAQESLIEYENIPLPKEKIGDNFKERIKAIVSEIGHLNNKKEKINAEKRSLERITDQVSNLLYEFSNDSIKNNVVLECDPARQWKSLSIKVKELRNDYNIKQRELTDKIKNTVSEYKESTLSEIIVKLDSVRVMVEDSDLKGNRLYTVGESILAMIDSIKKINSKIETDLREIENDFNDIVNQCFIQGKRMYTDLRMISASSKAHIYEGKPQTQMVKMDLPEENEISEESSRVSIKNEIEQGANELREMFKNGNEEKQILKRAKIIVGSERLLHKYIRQESISLKVYKIDLNSANSYYKRWEDTLTQSSGAEKFVVFFSVVLTLINYTRSAGLVSKNAKSVLILDNPFGNITSAHLLKPMFDIAKHFNVQLICFSDINKSDVISCFECVIKLVIKIQNLSSYEILTHEGNERIEHGYYKLINEQLSLL